MPPQRRNASHIHVEEPAPPQQGRSLRIVNATQLYIPCYCCLYSSASNSTHPSVCLYVMQSEDGSGHVEKAKAVVAPAEEDCQHPQVVPTSSHKEQDKEWAALTTWLRMNLHQLRTSKRQVLFTADSPAPGQPWVFQLNPNLTWDDINEDTKLRLKTLPEETEAAYARKYPKRPSSEWQHKTQKYRPQCSTSTVQVPLGEMVNSLRDIYFVQEGHQQQ